MSVCPARAPPYVLVSSQSMKKKRRHNVDITVFRRFIGRRNRPIAKAAIKPIGATPNPTESAVNPLIVKGLMIS